MADLDDFFAKKDRKRNKGQKKTEEGKKETARERPKQRDGEEQRTGQEEEEWKEYEETVKDYTGLKIQVLQTTTAGAAGETGGPVGDEAAQGTDAAKTKGPWNKPEAPEPVAEEEPPPEPQMPPTVHGGVYKPPVGRRPMPEPEIKKKQQNRNAPDIHNADYFPVLGATGKPRGGGGWSTAAGGGVTRSAQPARRSIVLDNRYTSLQDDS